MWNFLRRSSDADPEHLRSGKWGETEAVKFLKKKGFRILGRRVRVGRRDELDIVARHDDCLVFVEVKTRRSEAFGRPAASVDHRKRASLSRAAVRYLKRLRKKPEYYRFDVVEVIGHPDNGLEEIRHLESAFSLDRRYMPPV